VEAVCCHEAWLVGHYMPVVENISPGQNIGAVLESRVTEKRAALEAAIEEALSGKEGGDDG
jgi:hypothetical protein